MTYSYNGNQVKAISDKVGSLLYDGSFDFKDGADVDVEYFYDAAGNKLRTTHESVVTNTTDYIGNFIFEDGKLDKYLFDGGYCSFDNNQNPTFHYYEKDHLGSIRMVVNENGTIEQVNHYYPFGEVYGDLSYNAELQSLNFAKKAVNKNI